MLDIRWTNIDIYFCWCRSFWSHLPVPPFTLVPQFAIFVENRPISLLLAVDPVALVVLLALVNEPTLATLHSPLIVAMVLLSVEPLEDALPMRRSCPPLPLVGAVVGVGHLPPSLGHQVFLIDTSDIALAVSISDDGVWVRTIESSRKQFFLVLRVVDIELTLDGDAMIGSAFENKMT